MPFLKPINVVDVKFYLEIALLPHFCAVVDVIKLFLEEI